MSETLGSINAVVGADISAFEAGMAQVQADLGKVAAAADAAAGRYVDAQGRMREANGRFVSNATKAAEAAARAGGSIGTLGDAAIRTGGSINAGLVSSFSNFDRAIKPLNEGIGRLGEGLKGIGSGLTTYITLPLGLAGAGALAAYGKIDSLTRGLNALSTQDVAKQGATGVAAIGAAATETAQRLQLLQDIAKAPGIGFEEAVKGDIRLRAVGISAEQSASVLREFANAIALTGGSTAELNSVTTQLAQLSAKGKVLAQDLRPIIEAAPAVSQALIKLYGTVDSETISASLTKQGKSSQDFIAILTQALGELPRVQAGFTNSLENFQQGAVQDAAKIGESLNKAFDLQGLLDSAGRVFDGLTQKFTSLDPATQKLIFGFAAAAAAAGPVVFGLGAIIAAVPPVIAGLEALGLASTAALGPVGIAVGAVAAGAVLIIKNWDSIVSYFSGPAGDVFGDVASSAGQALSAIADALRAIANGPIGEIIAGLVKMQFAFAGKVLEAGLALVSGALSFLAGNIRVVTDLLSLDFQKALVDGANTARAVKKPFEDLLGLGQDKSANFSDFFKDILPAATQAGEGADYFSDAIARQIGLLEALKAELKDVKEQRDKETDTSAITADNARIKSIQAQIDKLEGVDKAGKKATDAVAKLRLELARLTALDNLLGSTPSQLEVAERRSDALAKGLKTLVDAGVSPSSRAFQAFATELANIGIALDKVKASGGRLELKPVNVKSLIPATIGDTLDADVARLLGDYAKKPIELPLHLEIKPIVGGLDTFSSVIENGVTKLGTGFTGPLLELSKGLRIANDSLTIFGGGFDVAGAKAAELQRAINTLIDAGVNPANPQIQELSKAYRDAAAQSQLFQLATQGAASGLSAIGEAIGGALASGADVFQAILGALLGALGDFVIKYGQTVILKGIADIAFGNVGQGIAEIAGGTALVAGGAFIKGSAGGASGGGGAISAPNSNYNSPAVANQQKMQITVAVVGEIRGRGTDLVGVLRALDYRSLRTN